MTCRADQMGGLRTGIRPVHIASASKMVTDFSGMPIQPHKVWFHHLTSVLHAPDMLVIACLLVSTQADIAIQLQSATTGGPTLQSASVWLCPGQT